MSDRIEIIATLKRSASPALIDARDRFVAEMSAKADQNGAEFKASVNDLYDIPVISDGLNAGLAAAVSRLDVTMRKAGLRKVPDWTQYGIHGGHSGGIEFWYQQRYTSA